MADLPKKSENQDPASDKEIRDNLFICHEYYDLEYAKSIANNLIKDIDKYFFKSKIIGFDEMPERNDPERPIIFASNHSGMAFPWDAIIFACKLGMQIDFKERVMFRALTAPALSKTNIMNPYMIYDFWKRAGGVDASFLNFETMMNQQESNVLIYPEGVQGIGKGFNHRYELQRFATSFIRMAVKYRTDIIPVVTVNGEYINPYVFSVKPINRLINKIGIPFLPLGPHTLFLLLFPWMFYYAWPARLVYVRGRRIKPYELIDKPYEDLNQEDIRRIRDMVKEKMQEDLDKAVREYGKPHFSTGKLLTWKFKDIWKMIYFSPPGWPMMFMEHDRQYRKVGREGVRIKSGPYNWLIYLFRNPLAIAFFIPLIGWIPLLYKGYLKKKGSGTGAQKKK